MFLLIVEIVVIKENLFDINLNLFGPCCAKLATQNWQQDVVQFLYFMHFLIGQCTNKGEIQF